MVGAKILRILGSLGYDAPERTRAGFDQERLVSHTAYSSHGKWLSPLVKGRAGSPVFYAVG